MDLITEATATLTPVMDGSTSLGVSSLMDLITEAPSALTPVMDGNTSLDVSALMDMGTDSWAAFILSLLEAVAGTVISSFIVFHILRNVFTGQTLRTKDKILLALSVSNIFSPIILFTSIVSNVFWDNFDYFSLILCYSLFLYGMSSSTWLTLCLCFFYFVKIIGFGSGYLSLMKKNIDVLVPWSILVVELVSLLASLLNFMLEFVSMDIPSSINGTESNLSRVDLYYVMYLGNLVLYPLIIVTTSCIMASVTIHIHRMRSHISGTISLEAHHRVIRTMRHLLAFYVVLYVLLIFNYLKFFSNLLSGEMYVIIMLTLSPVQSLIIIHGNTRLNESWNQMWRRLGLRNLLR